MPSESIENQLAEEKCLMEQKYASMLQQVLAQKRLVRICRNMFGVRLLSCSVYLNAHSRAVVTQRYCYKSQDKVVVL